MSEAIQRRGPLEFGWDRVITVVVSIAGLAAAWWTGYWIVWAVVTAAYFAGGYSFEWWAKNVDGERPKGPDLDD